MPHPLIQSKYVKPELLAAVQNDPSTAHVVCMLYQMGCATGELIAMGFTPEKVREAFEHALKNAIEANPQLRLITPLRE